MARITQTDLDCTPCRNSTFIPGLRVDVRDLPRIPNYHSRPYSGSNSGYLHNVIRSMLNGATPADHTLSHPGMTESEFLARFNTSDVSYTNYKLSITYNLDTSYTEQVNGFTDALGDFIGSSFSVQIFQYLAEAAVSYEADLNLETGQWEETASSGTYSRYDKGVTGIQDQVAEPPTFSYTITDQNYEGLVPDNGSRFEIQRLDNPSFSAIPLWQIADELGGITGASRALTPNVWLKSQPSPHNRGFRVVSSDASDPDAFFRPGSESVAIAVTGDSISVHRTVNVPNFSISYNAGINNYAGELYGTFTPPYSSNSDATYEAGYTLDYKEEYSGLVYNGFRLSLRSNISFASAPLREDHGLVFYDARLSGYSVDVGDVSPYSTAVGDGLGYSYITLGDLFIADPGTSFRKLVSEWITAPIPASFDKRVLHRFEHRVDPNDYYLTPDPTDHYLF